MEGLDKPERGLISPPAWGWPATLAHFAPLWEDFPTRVGMARQAGHIVTETQRFPHPRGDGPTTVMITASSSPISPPAWGWPGHRSSQRRKRHDFPTRVGMARDERQRRERLS